MREEIPHDRLYLSDVYCEENLDKTRKYVIEKMSEIRRKKNVPPEEDLSGISHVPHLLPNYRKICLLSSELDDITEFPIPIDEGLSETERCVWLLKQKVIYTHLSCNFCRRSDRSIGRFQLRWVFDIHLYRWLC